MYNKRKMLMEEIQEYQSKILPNKAKLSSEVDKYMQDVIDRIIGSLELGKEVDEKDFDIRKLLGNLPKDESKKSGSNGLSE